MRDDMAAKKVVKLSIGSLCVIVVAMLIGLMVYNNVISHTYDPSSQASLTRSVRFGLLQDVERNYITGRYSNLCLSNAHDVSRYCADYYSVWSNAGYVYCPVTKAGTAIRHSESHFVSTNTGRLHTVANNKDYFFFYVPATSEVWSFAHDHASGNFRWFAFLKTGCKRMSVNSISWYYQCDISDLTRDEMEKEKEYRLQQGLQPLK